MQTAPVPLARSEHGARRPKLLDLPAAGSRAGTRSLAVALMMLGSASAFCLEPAGRREIQLPPPAVDSDISVEEAIRARRSAREFAGRQIGLEAVGQLLWAAQGLTSSGGGRAAPSAGALYPLEVYLVAGEVTGLDAGIYRYRPGGHRLALHREGDHRKRLARSALGQRWVAEAPAVLVVAAVFERTRRKYGGRGERYVHIEVGHAAQNVYLQAQSLGLGTVMVGAFHDREVRGVLDLPDDESPLALMPVGHRD